MTLRLATRSRVAERPNPADRFGDWLNEPYRQAPVIAVLKAATYPMTLREISDAAGVPVHLASRVLFRLYKKGLVTRRKLPIQRHAFCRKTWKIAPHAARRMLYVYRLMDHR